MRQRALQHAFSATIGLSFGSAVILKQQPKVRFDSLPVPRSKESAVGKQERLDPELMRQLSGGSVTGPSRLDTPFGTLITNAGTVL